MGSSSTYGNTKVMFHQARLKKMALAIAVASATTGVAIPAAHAELTLEEIVVTARKREESIQNVPVAVTAITPEQFTRAAIINLEDATALTPGFTTQPSSVSPVAPALSMRGSTQSDQLITADPSVGVYLDGVFIARTYGIGVDLMDLESVQVLKGPQGTLFGRNSTAGAMLLKTADPQLDEFSGEVNVTMGSDDTRHGGVINVPLGEKFALRGAFQYNDRDDYVKNTTTGNDIGGRTSESSRVKLRFTPTDDLDMVLSHEQFEANVGGPVRDQTWVSGMVLKQDKGDDEVTLSFDPNSYTDTETTTFNLDYDTAIGQLKFIASTREWRESREADYDGGDLAVDPAVKANRRHGSWGRAQGDQDSYELQLNSSLFDDSVELVTGITYFKEYAELYDYSFGSDVYSASFVYGPGSLVNQDTESVGAYAQATIPLSDDTNLTLGLRHTQDQKEAYIHGTPSGSLFTVLPSWDFDYMLDNHVQLLPYLGITAPFGTQTPIAAGDILEPSAEWTSNDWLIGLDHQLNDDVLLYIKASTGFRAGGFNGRGIPAGSTATLEYAPEEVLEFEVGMKADFFDSRLRWNTALFMNETSDKQLTTIFSTGTGTGTALQNAGKAEAKGFETEVTYLLSDNWSLSGSWSYIDSEITEFEDDWDGDGIASPRPSNWLPLTQFAPENELSLSLNYDQEFSQFHLAGTLMYHWIDEMYGNDKPVAEVYKEISSLASSANANGGAGFTMADAESYVDAHTSDAYGTLNLNVTASTLDDMYSVTLWGRNILDKRAAASGIGFVAGDNYQYATVRYTEPMTWGVTLKAKF